MYQFIRVSIILTILMIWWAQVDSGKSARLVDCEKYVFHPHCRGTQAKKRLIETIDNADVDKICIYKSDLENIHNGRRQNLFTNIKLLEAMIYNGFDMDTVYNAFLTYLSSPEVRNRDDESRGKIINSIGNSDSNSISSSSSRSSGISTSSHSSIRNSRSSSSSSSGSSNNNSRTSTNNSRRKRRRSNHSSSDIGKNSISSIMSSSNSSNFKISSSNNGRNDKSGSNRSSKSNSNRHRNENVRIEDIIRLPLLYNSIGFINSNIDRDYS